MDRAEGGDKGGENGKGYSPVVYTRWKEEIQIAK